MRQKPTRHGCTPTAFLRSGGRTAALLVSRRILHPQNAGSQNLPNLSQSIIRGHDVGVWAHRRPSDPRLRRRIKLHHEIGLLRQQGEQHLDQPQRLSATVFAVYPSAFWHDDAGSEAALQSAGPLPDRHHVDRWKVPMLSTGVWVVHLLEGHCDLQLSVGFPLVRHRRLPFSIRTTSAA